MKTALTRVAEQVMGMGFMQKNMEKQRKEAGKLLEDLKRMEEGKVPAPEKNTKSAVKQKRMHTALVLFFL